MARFPSIRVHIPDPREGLKRLYRKTGLHSLDRETLEFLDQQREGYNEMGKVGFERLRHPIRALQADYRYEGMNEGVVPWGPGGVGGNLSKGLGKRFDPMQLSPEEWNALAKTREFATRERAKNRGPKGRTFANAEDAGEAWQEHVFMKPGMTGYRDYILGPQLERMERVPAGWKGGKVRREGSPMQRELNRRFEGPAADKLRASYHIDEAEENAFEWIRNNPDDWDNLPPHLDTEWDRALERFHAASQREIKRPKLAYSRPRDPIIRDRHIGAVLSKSTPHLDSPRLNSSPKGLEGGGRRIHFGTGMGGPRTSVTLRKFPDMADQRVTRKTGKRLIQDIRRSQAGLKPIFGQENRILYKRRSGQ